MDFDTTEFHLTKQITYIYEPILEAPYPKKVLDIYNKDAFPKKVLDIFNKNEFPKKVLDIYTSLITPKTYEDIVEVIYHSYRTEETITEFLPINDQGQIVEGISPQYNHTIEIQEVLTT